MIPRRLFCGVMGITLAAALGYHAMALQKQSQFARELQRQEEECDALRRVILTENRGLETIQKKLETLRFEVATPSASVTSDPVQRSSALSLTPELKKAKAQCFVSEQRLRFASLFKRLGWDERQLGEFDRIERNYEEAVLEDLRTPETARAARNVLDQQLQNLFGSNYDQWKEANRDDPARALTKEIVRQTFQGLGALTPDEADQITRIIAASRSFGPSGQFQIDWDRILAESRNVLAPLQWDGFVTAIGQHRASDDMTDIMLTRRP